MNFWFWRRELTFLFIAIALAAIISHFVGFFAHMLVLILVFALIHQAKIITGLENWLSHGARGKVPTSYGIWGDIYYHLFRIRKKDKQRKKKLGAIIDQFRKSTNVLPDAAVVIGKHDEIEWSNKLSRQVLGIKKSDKGQRIDNLIRSPEFVNFLKSNEEKKTLTLTSPINSAIILKYRKVSYGLSQQLIIAHDVTQQINMEDMRKTFVDNISHELRTPLTVLKGYIETLQDEDENYSALLKNSLSKMNDQTARMQYLVDDLLLLAHLETQQLTKKSVDIVHMIRDICLESEIAQNSQRIELNLESDNQIYGEERDLRSAFSNLLINALKYSADDSPVIVVWKQTSYGMIFDVIDQGEGIAYTEIPRVTERFYRSNVRRKKKLSGTGLGLAIVKHVLIRHDAKLEITSQLGKGSQFRCIFPNSCLISASSDNTSDNKDLLTL